MASNWTLTYASCFTSNAAESFGKKYPAEFAQVMANVQTFLDALNDGAKLEQLKREKSFVHNEGKGVVSIMQQPLRRNAHPLRLYIYPDETSHTVHILSIGDKKHQEKDVNEVHQFVKKNL